jgi:hypothetical protein
MSLESRASRVSVHPPAIMVSDESMGEEIELLLSPTRGKAMAGA